MKIPRLDRAAGLFLVALTSAGVSAAAPDCPNGGTVRFGVEPFEAPAALVPIYEEFKQILADQLDCKVQIFITSSYTAEIEAMRAGKLEMGEFGPFQYVLAHTVAGAQAIAQFAGDDGTPVSYWASIVAWQDAKIDTLSDLKGKPFAYADPASTSGHLLPAYALKKQGMDPDNDPKVFYAGNHTAAFEALRHRKVVASELNSDTLALAMSQGIYNEVDYVTVWKSDPIPLDTIALSPQLTEPFRSRATKIIQGLVLVPPMKAEHFKVLGNARRLVPANDETYKTIAEVAAIMNMKAQ